MRFRTLVGITLIAVGTSLPSRAPAEAQSALDPVSRIAYEWCWYYVGEDRYVCSVAAWVDGIETFVASHGYEPKWSPDGGRIAFTAGDHGEAGIQVANLSDLSVYNLPGSQAFDRGSAWSPDGSKIAFVSNRTGIAELYRVNDDG